MISVKEISTEDEELEFFKISEDLVQLPILRAALTSSIDFDGHLDPPLLLHEDLAQGCGGQSWPAGKALTKYILSRHRDALKDKTIVEIGAGSGLVGLAVALGCSGFQKPIHITDQENMLPLMHRNIQSNGLGRSDGLDDTVRAAVYDWGEPPPEDIPAHPDILLAADCVYFEPAFPLLEKTLGHLIGYNTVCYFSFQKRRRADLHFVKTIKKMFEVEEVRDDPNRDQYAKDSIFLFKIQRKRQGG